MVTDSQKDFPPTIDENGEKVPFFYIRGGYNIELQIKEELQRMSHVDYFYCQFDAWQSNAEGFKDFLVRPDNKTNIYFHSWNSINRKIQLKDAKDWYIRMFAEDKPGMFIALKDLESKNFFSVLIKIYFYLTF